MLKFSTNNNFSYQSGQNQKLIGLPASKTKLIPFQFFLTANIEPEEFEIVGFDLRRFDGTLIDLSSDLNKFQIFNNGNDFYVVFNGTSTLATTIEEGIFQIVINLELHGISSIYYSNFFHIINDTNILGSVTYYNSVDFDNKIFQDGYKNILYIENQAIILSPFTKEIITERSDGSKEYEQQVMADVFGLQIFSDVYGVSELQKIQLFDNLELLIFGEIYSNFLRFEFEQNFEQNFYKGLLKFYVNKIEKTLADENYSIIKIENIFYFVNNLENNFVDNLGNKFICKQ